MKPYDKYKPLVSIHIPKCGGTAFQSVLKSWFIKKFYLHYFVEKQNRMPEQHNVKISFLSRELHKKGACIHGHFNKSRGFGVWDYYPDADQFITILRDPFEIALSNYFYGVKRNSERYRDGRCIPAKEEFKNIEDYLLKRNSYLLSFFPFELTPDNYKELLDQYFIYIGILEDMKTSLKMLSKKLNVPEIKINHINTSERLEEIPDNAKDIFIQKNRLEYEISNWALSKYTL